MRSLKTQTDVQAWTKMLSYRSPHSLVPHVPELGNCLIYNTYRFIGRLVLNVNSKPNTNIKINIKLLEHGQQKQGTINRHHRHRIGVEGEKTTQNFDKFPTWLSRCTTYVHEKVEKLLIWGHCPLVMLLRHVPLFLLVSPSFGRICGIMIPDVLNN